MDIKCRKCGEPWDTDCLHEEVAERWENEPWKIDGVMDQTEYERHLNLVRDDFYANGCRAFFGARCNEENIGDENAKIIGVLYDEFGDDLDGVAAMVEDFRL